MQVMRNDRAESTGLSKSDLEYIKGVFSRFNEVEKCILFGSRAKGVHRNGSDVDIAVVGAEVGHATIRDISFILNEESPLPYHFDIASYNRITNSSLLDHIDRVGFVVYSKE
jgi:predicted nucleotidyltransferase